MSTRTNKRRIDAEKASDLYRQGILVGDIAAELNCSIAYVYQLVREHGAKRRDQIEWEAKKAKAISLFKGSPDMTARIIASLVKVHYSTVCRWLRGVPREEMPTESVYILQEITPDVKLPEEIPDNSYEEKESEEW